MRFSSYYASALAFGSASSCSAFVTPQQSPTAKLNLSRGKHNSSIHKNIVFDLRGGDINTSNIMPSSSTGLFSVIDPTITVLHQTLVSGSPLRAVGALYAISSLVVTLLTWYRTAYSFSVGYGLSVAAMSAALLSAFGGLNTSSAPSILAVISMVYGVRLAGFIFLRENTVASKKEAFDKLNTKPFYQRTPLALMVALLYSFMVCPVLFALRGSASVSAGSVADKIQLFFTGVAAFGILLESVADQHKYQVKKRTSSKDGDGEEDKFVGPTSWSYKLCRHPNYFGEILHWVGLFGAGSVSFGKSAVAWVSGSLGLMGILSIMFMASAGLDKKQEEKYAGQVKYDAWKGKVSSSVIPLIK